jgi:hypothetical protein
MPTARTPASSPSCQSPPASLGVRSCGRSSSCSTPACQSTDLARCSERHRNVAIVVALATPNHRDRVRYRLPSSDLSFVNKTGRMSRFLRLLLRMSLEEDRNFRVEAVAEPDVCSRRCVPDQRGTGQRWRGRCMTRGTTRSRPLPRRAGKAVAVVVGPAAAGTGSGGGFGQILVVSNHNVRSASAHDQGNGWG